VLNQKEKQDQNRFTKMLRTTRVFFNATSKRACNSVKSSKKSFSTTATSFAKVNNGNNNKFNVEESQFSAVRYVCLC